MTAGFSRAGVRRPERITRRVGDEPRRWQERGEPSLDLERDLVCIGDARGYFVSLNRAWERVLGWSREELFERPLIEFVHPDDVGRTARELGRVDELDYHLVDFENRYRHRDGGYRWLSWSARSDGEQFLGVAVDVTERKEEEERLGRTLDDGRLLAYAQPIVTVRSGEIERGELLVRMRDNGGVLPPAAFLPAAEELGLIGRIDRWMIEYAAAASEADEIVHVNVSARTIDDADTVGEVHRIVADAPNPERLVFELTETAAISNLDAARAFAEPLLSLGCEFALDDFGTGYGSLTYLQSLPLRLLKIDRRFIGSLVSSAEDRALVRSIVALARELGLQTVAEGVEDEATYEAVSVYGVDYVQGYLIGRPAPAAI